METAVTIFFYMVAILTGLYLIWIWGYTLAFLIMTIRERRKHHQEDTNE